MVAVVGDIGKCDSSSSSSSRSRKRDGSSSSIVLGAASVAAAVLVVLLSGVPLASGPRRSQTQASHRAEIGWLSSCTENEGGSCESSEVMGRDVKSVCWEMICDIRQVPREPFHTVTNTTVLRVCYEYWNS